MSDTTTSWYLNDDELIFPYDSGNTRIPAWYVAKMGTRKSGFCGRNIARFYGDGLVRYSDEQACRLALKEYAERHGLKPAW